MAEKIGNFKEDNRYDPIDVNVGGSFDPITDLNNLRYDLVGTLGPKGGIRRNLPRFMQRYAEATGMPPIKLFKTLYYEKFEYRNINLEEIRN